PRSRGHGQSKPQNTRKRGSAVAPLNIWEEQELQMVRKTLMFCGVVLASLVLSGAASAQESATLVMRNGERLSGELVDLGGVGFTFRVGGQDRQIPVSEVAAVEFQPGAASPAVQSRVSAGQSVVVLRSGEVIEGRLADI